MTIQDRIVMITGGASGIGRIMGEIALKKRSIGFGDLGHQPNKYRCNNW